MNSLPSWKKISWYSFRALPATLCRRNQSSLESTHSFASEETIFRFNEPKLYSRRSKLLEAKIFVEASRGRKLRNPLKINKDQRAPSPMDRAKEEIKAVFHHEKIHHKETHGTSDDIDENTPIDRVKGPNLLERAKEEIEALIEAIHPKKSSEDEKAQ
ncbi:unnamed protein product [Spirodela intermedia]|uniref:Uncharacterized protein n=1 Tax=Spirodela intermedia TaxID=51605 RepID=A0A7I8LJS6_SPIIN|nr:unnamed protein product [Spirodela intermedia]